MEKGDAGKMGNLSRSFVALNLNWRYQYELKRYFVYVKLSLDRLLLTKRMQSLERQQILDLEYKMYRNEPRIYEIAGKLSKIT